MMKISQLFTASLLSLLSLSAYALGPAATNGTSEHYACTHSGSKLNMRSGAGQDFKVVAKVDHGTPLLVVDARKAKDGFEWYKVRAGKRVGWVRSDYACF